MWDPKSSHLNCHLSYVLVSCLLRLATPRITLHCQVHCWDERWGLPSALCIRSDFKYDQAAHWRKQQHCSMEKNPNKTWQDWGAMPRTWPSIIWAEGAYNLPDEPRSRWAIVQRYGWSYAEAMLLILFPKCRRNHEGNPRTPQVPSQYKMYASRRQRDVVPCIDLECFKLVRGNIVSGRWSSRCCMHLICMACTKDLPACYGPLIKRGKMVSQHIYHLRDSICFIHKNRTTGCFALIRTGDHQISSLKTGNCIA